LSPLPPGEGKFSDEDYLEVRKPGMNRILVVDDETNNLKAIKRLLRRDYILEFAQNGDEALKLIPDFNPDLILLDIMMPGIDGYEVCRRLKSDSKTSGIMVLLVSAKSALEDRLRGYEVGTDDYIIKPYEPEELRAKVRILLRLKNAQDELRTVNRDLEKLVAVKTRELVKQERQAIVGQMVQGIVHNLRGPLTVVHVRAEIACETARKLLEISKDDELVKSQNSPPLAGLQRRLAGARGDEGEGEHNHLKSLPYSPSPQPSPVKGEGVFGLFPKSSKDDPDNFQKLAENVIHNLDSLLEAVDRTDLLIDSLLAKGRQEAAGEKQRLNLNDIIAQEIKFLDADMDLKHGVKKYLDLDPSIPDLYGTYSDFSQVTYNLIKNASEAMKNLQKKELRISTRHDDENIYIIFQDTGSGISSEDLERIFDPFFTTKPGKEPDNAGEPTGTGLGLYTCSQLMKYYGGEISAQSKLGAGTTFTITIPQKRPLLHD
ncbi:MAG: hybrid sensor histidine kinase/response regulator, partial [Thermodesulfobacteriota bacterium]|nr:hybrid sensor histidine kinase/response regulator [Thermodesulfobacteriota bacterium]